MNYFITAAQLQALNVLIDKGGAGTTSKVSDSLAALQPNVMPAGQQDFNAAVQYNIQNAKVYGDMQKLHDQVKKQPLDTPQPSPPDNGGDQPAPGTVMEFPTEYGPTPKTRYNSTSPLAQGVIYEFAGRGKKKLSWAISSGGYPCYASFDVNNIGPGKTPGYTGGTPWENAPETEDGQWSYFVMFEADPGRVQDAHIDMLDA